MLKNFGVATYAGELSNTLSIHWNQNCRWGRYFGKTNKSKIWFKYSPTDFFEGCRQRGKVNRDYESQKNETKKSIPYIFHNTCFYQTEVWVKHAKQTFDFKLAPGKILRSGNEADNLWVDTSWAEKKTWFYNTYILSPPESTIKNTCNYYETCL